MADKVQYEKLKKLLAIQNPLIVNEMNASRARTEQMYEGTIFVQPWVDVRQLSAGVLKAYGIVLEGYG